MDGYLLYFVISQTKQWRIFLSNANSLNVVRCLAFSFRYSSLRWIWPSCPYPFSIRDVWSFLPQQLPALSRLPPQHTTGTTCISWFLQQQQQQQQHSVQTPRVLPLGLRCSVLPTSAPAWNSCCKCIPWENNNIMTYTKMVCMCLCQECKQVFSILQPAALPEVSREEMTAVQQPQPPPSSKEELKDIEQDNTMTSL